MAYKPTNRPPGRPASVEIRAGSTFGHWTVRRVVRVKNKKGVLQKQFQCECICGTKRNMPGAYLTRKNGPSTNCGCKTYAWANKYPYEKRCWYMMHVRCYYEKHVAYAQYGGRGITVCERWHRDREDGKGFDNFVEDMGRAPIESKYTIDRIDNDKGYYKENCRWADKKTQRANQRPRS